MDLLGDKGFDSMAVFGFVATKEDKFEAFLKKVLNLDPEARGDDALPASRLTMAWTNCRKRSSSVTSTTQRRTG